MQLNNGQEEPIFPRLESLSQNLGQAEQTLGEPSNQFNASSITTAITGRPPMNRGGVASLVNREKYGLGSKIKGALKSAARTFIPKELDPVLKFAAPFLGPVYGPIASIAGSARTGKIDPFSLAAATLPYVQFGGGSGLGSLMPTGYGGSQYGIFGGDYVGLGSQGTSLSQLISDKAKEFLSPNTPVQNLIKGAQDVSGAEKFYADTGKYGFSDPEFLDLGTNREIGQLYSEDFLKNAPEFKPISTQGPGYVDLIKRAGSLENVPLSERFNAVKDLSTKALKDIYTTPVINPKTGETTYKLDKNSLYATFAGASSYIEARKLADKAGIPESEFSEADYQRFKVQPEKEKYTDILKPGSFGIRPQSANGGLMDGVLSIKLTPAMAMGGRIDYETGGPTTTTPAKTLPMDLDSLARRLFNTNLDNLSPSEKQYLYEFKEQYKNKKAKGGIMGSEIPLRQNEGGITELDLRAKGGYIPVGIKEKADDVPAMLSKNEFVFTADAVRGAGNGNINKGAQKMYKLMKSLEKKVKKMKKVA